MSAQLTDNPGGRFTTPAPEARNGAAARGGHRVPKQRTLLRNLLFTVAGAVLILGGSYFLDDFQNYQLATIGAYFVVTAGLTVLTGLNGQLSLGHGALMAVGAYTLAMVQNKLAESSPANLGTLIAGIFAAIVVTTLAGAVIGVAAARLRGPYLAGLTLAIAVVVPAVTSTFDGTFNSVQGLFIDMSPKPPVQLGDMPVPQWQVWFVWIFALIAVLLLANFTRSRFGRNFKAVRDDEAAARLSGINIARTQVLAFVVSSACAGLGGALMAILFQSVSPGAFQLTLSLFLLMAIVIGGLGSIPGALIGAFLLVALPEATHAITDSISVDPATAQRLEGNLPLALFGLTLIVVMLAFPGGIASLGRSLKTRFTSKKGSK